MIASGFRPVSQSAQAMRKCSSRAAASLISLAICGSCDRERSDNSPGAVTPPARHLAQSKFGNKIQRTPLRYL